MKKLSKEEMKKVVGGMVPEDGGRGTCRYHHDQGPIHSYSECMTKEAAIAGANAAAQYWPNAKWCCDSCVSLGFPEC